jgi:hypothetical protein
MSWARRLAFALLWLLPLSVASGASADAGRGTNAAAMVPPMPTRSSPIDFFRELLAMSSTERKAALTNRPAENQKAILAKVREYEAMKPDQREWKLKATELRWYLAPLMRSPATNREAQLTAIPESDRQMVTDHITQWDALPGSVQAEFLRHQDTMRFLLYSEIGGTPISPLTTSTNLSQARVKKLQQGVREWQSLPENRRDELIVRFNQFFELNSAEKEKSLNSLSDAERRQIEKTLAKFKDLTPARRAECLRSFEKFAGMSLYERQQFLKNAEKWKLMKPEERATWKSLVDVAPMLPPQSTSTRRPPPLPKLFPRRNPPLATNGSQ